VGCQNVGISFGIGWARRSRQVWRWEVDHWATVNPAIFRNVSSSKPNIPEDNADSDKEEKQTVVLDAFTCTCSDA